MNLIKKIDNDYTCQYFCIGTAGALKGKSVINEINDYINILKTRSDFAKKPFLKIGHKAGLYKNYPKGAETINARTFNVTRMMDICFNKFDLDGIEIDIKQDQLGLIDKGKKIYIVHNDLKGDIKDNAVKYLKNNTLEKVLLYYIKKNYYLNKKLYLEIKIKNSQKMNTQDIELINQTIDTIDRVLNNFPKKQAIQIKKNICFVSFSFAVLEYIYSNQKHNRYPFYLVTATNRPIIWLLIKVFPQLKCLNFLNKKLIKKISSSDFLSGIWFDPGAINNFVKVFNKINSLKKKKLDIFISTYKLDKIKFLRKFKRKNKKLKNLKASLFEIDS